MFKLVCSPLLWPAAGDTFKWLGDNLKKSSNTKAKQNKQKKTHRKVLDVMLSFLCMQGFPDVCECAGNTESYPRKWVSSHSFLAMV